MPQKPSNSASRNVPTNRHPDLEEEIRRLVSVIWLCDEAKHFRGMELAFNGVDCRAINCFDLTRVPHLGEQMNAEQPPIGRNTGFSCPPKAR